MINWTDMEYAVVTTHNERVDEIEALANQRREMAGTSALRANTGRALLTRIASSVEALFASGPVLRRAESS